LAIAIPVAIPIPIPIPSPVSLTLFLTADQHRPEQRTARRSETGIHVRHILTPIM